MLLAEGAVREAQSYPFEYWESGVREWALCVRILTMKVFETSNKLRNLLREGNDDNKHVFKDFFPPHPLQKKKCYCSLRGERAFNQQESPLKHRLEELRLPHLKKLRLTCCHE